MARSARADGAVAAVLVLGVITLFVVLLVNDHTRWAAGVGAALVLVGIGAAYAKRKKLLTLFGGGMVVLGGGGKGSPVNAKARELYGPKWFEKDKEARLAEAKAALGITQTATRKHSDVQLKRIDESKRVKAKARDMYGKDWWKTDKEARLAEAKAALGIKQTTADDSLTDSSASDDELDLSSSSDEDDSDDDRPLFIKRRNDDLPHLQHASRAARMSAPATGPAFGDMTVLGGGNKRIRAWRSAGSPFGGAVSESESEDDLVLSDSSASEDDLVLSSSSDEDDDDRPLRWGSKKRRR